MWRLCVRVRPGFACEGHTRCGGGQRRAQYAILQLDLQAGVPYLAWKAGPAFNTQRQVGVEGIQAAKIETGRSEASIQLRQISWRGVFLARHSLFAFIAPGFCWFSEKGPQVEYGRNQGSADMRFRAAGVEHQFAGQCGLAHGANQLLDREPVLRHVHACSDAARTDIWQIGLQKPAQFNQVFSAQTESEIAAVCVGGSLDGQG